MSALYVATCEECGWESKGSRTEGRAAYGLRRHSCAKQRELEARERRKQERAAKVAATRVRRDCTHHGQHQHGTRTAYVLDRCRCGPCTTAATNDERDRRRRHAYGQPPLVDATPAVEHIERLRAAGLGLRTICDLSGVSHGSIYPLVYGRHDRRGGKRRTRARRETVDAILAVRATLDALPGGVRIHTVGTRRRLQALATLGWSLTRIADQAGVDRQTLDHAMSAPTTTVTTARAVRDVYERLWDTPPAARDRHDQAGITRVRTRAAKEGWAPPMAWDNIDDPTERPEGIRRRTA